MWVNKNKCIENKLPSQGTTGSDRVTWISIGLSSGLAYKINESM